MDFQRLTRRELQALCKKNKIPANMTNVAMADSLNALEIVEGIEEFLQTCESETAQSSIESPVRSEVTSPYVPPTGGRSTRRRNVAKEEPQTAKPSARAQRTTRRTLVKYADESQAEAIETPAVVTQTNRKKGQIASAGRKIDSQLKECVDDAKKDDLVTPAPSGVTSRRRRVAKEESAVQHIYSTRRSVRLAKKNGVLLNDVGNENTDASKKDLFTNDLDEVSGITEVVDADTTVEETSEKKDEAEVVSDEKLEISAVNEVGLVPTIEEETSNHSDADGVKLELKESSDVEIEVEVVSAEKQDTITVNEVGQVLKIEKETSDHSEADGAKSELKESGDVEIEEVEFGSEIEAEVDKEKCDETEAPWDENEARENHGSHGASEIGIEVKKIEEQNTDKDAGLEDQAANFGENLVPDSEQDMDKDPGCEDQAANSGEYTVLQDNFAIGEVSCDTNSNNEIEKVVSDDNKLESEDVTDLNVNDEVLEINDSGKMEFNPDESNSVILEAAEDSTDVTYLSKDDLSADTHFDITLMNEEEEASKWDAVNAYVSEKRDATEEKDETNLVKDAELEMQQSTEEVLPGEVQEPGEVDTIQPEENEKAADPVYSEASDYLIDALTGGEAVGEQIPGIENSPSKPLEIIVCGEPNADFPDQIPTSGMDDEEGDQIPPNSAGLDSCIVQPTCLTPIRASASKASAKKKKVTAVSDNKENIGSGSKLVLTKERVKKAKATAKNDTKYDGLSMRQLSKMLKEKLQITSQSSKNENDNEVLATARLALQALPENR